MIRYNPQTPPHRPQHFTLTGSRPPGSGVAWWLLIFLCSCSIATSPDSVPPSWQQTVNAEWAITVADLELRGVPRSRIDTVKQHHFSWVEHPGPFECKKGQLANGCYRTGFGKHDTIEWNAQTPHVLHHEIGHAILHKLGYDCWKEYQHTERGCPHGW